MHEKDIVLPGDQPAKLLYLMDYPTARDGMLSIAWLQQRKFGNQQRKQAYDADLGKMTAAFVERLIARPEFPPDVVLVPASGSRLYDPFLTRLREARPELLVVDGLFAKEPGFEAGIDGQPFDEVLQNLTLIQDELPQSLIEATRILIIDDIFNTGNTAWAMIARVRPSMPAQPQVIVAFPLYVPLEPKEQAVDWEAAMQEVLNAPQEGSEELPENEDGNPSAG